MKIDSIFQEVLDEIRLDKKSLKDIKNSCNFILKKLKSAGLDAKVGGSLAKDTIIKNKNPDVDIFVVLDKREISTLEKKIKKTKLKYKIVHGSRDYVQIDYNNITFEIIPVLKIKKLEEIENVTDFSLVHVKYIKKIILKNKKLTDEIRLAKAFCHAQNVYGAESYIGGFSGYALEVLVSYYGSFLKFLMKIRKDRVIDPEMYFKNRNEIFRELNQNKLQSPVVLIDPTYKYRNVCAGLSRETFDKFLVSLESFLKEPSKEFFVKKEFSLNDFLDEAEKKRLDVYRLNVKTDRQEGDIAGTKMKKFMRFIIEELERKEQKVFFSEFVYSGEKTAEVYLAIEKRPLIEIVGPKKDMEKAVEAFKRVREHTYIVKGFVCAKEKVEIPSLLERQKTVAQGMGVSFGFEKI